MSGRSDKADYGWRFPDGEVVPVEDEFAIATKLRAMDRFWEIQSLDMLHTGYWYEDRYSEELQRIVEDGCCDPERFLDDWNIEIVPGKGKAKPSFRLPDGTVVDEAGLELWFIDGGYTFEAWFRFNRYGDEFKDELENEIDRLLYDDDPDELLHYGIRRVRLDESSPFRRVTTSKVKPGNGAPKRDSRGRFVSGKVGKGKTAGRRRRVRVREEGAGGAPRQVCPEVRPGGNRAG